MRIGIDARMLSERVAGIGRYTSQITAELAKKSHDFFLYTPRPPITGDWSRKNITLRTSNCSGRAYKLLWSWSVLPALAWHDDVDIFWGATHRLPPILPRSTARVVTIHDLTWKYAGETMPLVNRFLEKRLMPHAINKADRIIADSQSTMQAIMAQYPHLSNKVRVVHLGLTTLPKPNKFLSLETIGITRPYFLFVGTLEPRKNLSRLLKAYSLLDEKTQNQAMMVIAGGQGWGRGDVRDLVISMGLSGRVLVTGYVNESLLSTLYANALFLAMPSIYEGFGLPLIEAMSFGIPVLTSSVSSMPEVAHDAGLFVDPHDEHSIASKLNELIYMREIRNQLALKAKLNSRRFSWIRAARETMAIFEEAYSERCAKMGV